MASFKRFVVFAWLAFIVAVLIASTVLAILMRFGDFNGHSFLLGSGDQKPLQSGLYYAESFSRYYCQDLDVTVAKGSGEGAIFSAYALPSVPYPSGQSYKQMFKQTNAIGPHSISSPFAFHLHRDLGAVAWMKVHACSVTTSLMLYRCPDESTAAAWQKSGNSQGCEVMCQYSRCGAVQENYCYFVASSADHVDEFVFVLAALEGSPLDKRVYIDGEITRYPYDLREHVAACLNTTRCELAVDMTGTTTVVLEVPPEVTANSILLQTECRARIGIYFAFFLGFPLAVILVASVLVFLPCYILQKTLKKQNFELQVKGLGGNPNPTSIPPSQHDGAGLLDNEHLNDNW